jgi:hypothetical protein
MDCVVARPNVQCIDCAKYHSLTPFPLIKEAIIKHSNFTFTNYKKI